VKERGAENLGVAGELKDSVAGDGCGTGEEGIALNAEGGVVQ
jgi:hypothetical protein